MTEAQAIEAITAAFNGAWQTQQPTVPVLDENEASTAFEAWVRLSVTHTSRQQATLGQATSRRFEARGLISVQIFGVPNAGRHPVSLLADNVRQILESASLPQRDGSGNPLVGGDAVITFGARTQEVRDPKDAGTWYMVVVLVPFLYWETR